MKNLGSKMKTSTIQQKRTPQGRRESQQNNRKRSHSDYKRKSNQENSVKQQKTNPQKNVTSPLKESTKENQQKNETIITSKPPQQKPATSSDSNPPTLPTRNSPPPSSDALSLFAEEFSEDELQEAFKEVATMDFPQDLFPPVVKVNSNSASLSETILGAISSDSDSYTPTPIPSTAPVYKPTPLNLKDNKLQHLKDAQKKRIVLNVGGRKFETSVSTLLAKPDGLLAKMIGPKGIKPYSVDNLYTYFLDRNPNYFSYILDYLRNHGTFNIDCLPVDLSSLQLLTLEAKYFDLRHLQLLCEKKSIDIHLRTNAS